MQRCQSYPSTTPPPKKKENNFRSNLLPCQAALSRIGTNDQIKISDTSNCFEKVIYSLGKSEGAARRTAWCGLMMDRPTKRLRTDVGEGADPPAPPPPNVSHPLAKAAAAGHTVSNAARKSHSQVEHIELDAVSLLGSLRQSHAVPASSAAAVPAARSHPTPPAPALPKRGAPALTMRQAQHKHEPTDILELEGQLNEFRQPPDAIRTKAQLIQECAARDSRCSRVVGFSNLSDVRKLFKGTDHVMADVVGDGE